MQIGIGLMFPGNLQDEAVICDVCKKFDIVLKIIEASFSSEQGWAILKLEGQEAEVNNALQYLAGKDIKIQQMQKKDD